MLATLSNPRSGPDFLGIGVSRSGTTSTYMALKQHPGIMMTEQREVHYFSFMQDRMQGQSGRLNQLRQRYRGLFSQKGDRLGGEFSPSYLFYPDADKRIINEYPDVKLICILRDPVSRAISDFYYSGLEKETTPYDFMKQGVDEVRKQEIDFQPYAPSTVIYKGLYSQHLSRFEAEFPPEQLLVLTNTQLKEDGRRFFHRIFDFLGLDMIDVDFGEIYNPNEYPEERDDSAAIELLSEFYADQVDFYHRLVERERSESSV